MAEDRAGQRTERDRSVSAALMGTMPFSWPSSKPNMAATHCLTSTASFSLSPPGACLGPGIWFLKLTFVIRPPKGSADVTTGLGRAVRVGICLGGLGHRVRKGNPSSRTLKQGRVS